jgi:hypothetical protein
MRRTVVANLPPKSAVADFARWVARECPSGARVLNIGAGSGLSGPLHPVRRQAAYLVGIDPDPAIFDHDDLDERHQMTLEEYAATSPQPFDAPMFVKRLLERCWMRVGRGVTVAGW